MCAEEVRLILQLSTSLKLLLAPVTTARDRERGSTLLYDYLVGYKEVRLSFMHIITYLHSCLDIWSGSDGA